MEVVDLGVFVRAWAVQARRMAWLLGAGASASAGVPTAAQIIDDLLLRLYADEFGIVRQALDVADPAVADRIRLHYQGKYGIPERGARDEYSAVFEIAINDEAARREYLRQLLRGRRPCYGQRVLGAAVSAQLVDLLITTNFDELIETAVADARTAAEAAPLLSVAALDSAPRATAAVADDEWPLLIKLHGDFRELPLKNLDGELQTQDATLRQAVVDASRRFGLAVSGYSGRDQSVMRMLQDASTHGAWPAGLWWLTRTPRDLPPAVIDLLSTASGNGVSAYAVHGENFDEIMGSLASQVSLPTGLREYVDALRPPTVVSKVPYLTGSSSFPVLRLNALPVLGTPSEALRLPTTGLNGDEFRERLKAGGWRGTATLGPDEILAFGSADDLRRCLDVTGAATRVAIDPLNDNAPSHVVALATEAITRAVARRLPARPGGRRTANQLICVPPRADEPAHIADARQRLIHAYDDSLTGTLPNNCGTTPSGEPRTYAEGVRLRLERAVDTTWLVFTPFTWVAPMRRAADETGAIRPVDPAADWRRERWVKRRRNEKWATLIATWAQVIASDDPRTVLHVLSRRQADETTALDGVFMLGSITAYSRQAT